MEKIINSKEEMMQFANEVGKILQVGDVVLIKGNLGAGKTFFSSCLINSLQEKKDNVTSPTFNIVQHYQTSKGQISHFDLYRIKNISELENINFREIISDDICLIEWPEIAENYFRDAMKINIIIDGKSRLVKCSFNMASTSVF
jgi:tRNA threonylcarbamoyladenosine biosynthesis protein TsaE